MGFDRVPMALLSLFSRLTSGGRAETSPALLQREACRMESSLAGSGSGKRSQPPTPRPLALLGAKQKLPPLTGIF